MTGKQVVAAILLSAALLGCRLVAAQDSAALPWYEQRHGELRLGGFFVKHTNTHLLLESNSNPLAATVNFQRELGLESRLSVGRIRFAYQFSPRHRMDLSYFKLERSGDAIVFERELEIGDITIPIGASVISQFDTEILKVAYTNMFYRSEKVRLGFSAGFNFSSFDIRADFETTPPPGGGSPNTGGEQADGAVPLPVMGGRLSYSISPKWIQITSADVFMVSSGGYSGVMTNLELLVENRVSRRVGWGVGLEFLSFDLNTEDDDFTGTFQSTARGINLYASVYF